MPVVNVRDCRFEVSQSSSVRVRVDRAVDLVERRVVRWAIGLQCVLANAVRCIRRVPCRHRVDARWAQAVREWLDVRWVLDLVFRLLALLRHVRVHVRQLPIVALDRDIRVLAASRKDR